MKPNLTERQAKLLENWNSSATPREAFHKYWDQKSTYEEASKAYKKFRAAIGRLRKKAKVHARI